MEDFIYLASQSPRRRQLLEQIGVAIRLLPPQAGEDVEQLEVVQADEEPGYYVRRVTGLKLDAAVARLSRLVAAGAPAAPILCADTTVAVGPKIYGKPRDAADAARMLGALSGTTHRVITALAVQAGGRRLEATSESLVTFGSLTNVQVQAYVATGEPLDKAGAYAVQGRASMFVSRIEGSYTGIVGLPMFETVRLLREAGFEV